MSDTLAWPVMQGLLRCLEEEYDRAISIQKPAFIGLVPGALVPADYIGENCGMAWVRFLTAFRTEEFPTPSTRMAGDLPWVFTLEVGTYRCAPVPKKPVNGRMVMPSMEEQHEATRVQMADFQVIRKAVHCCLGEDYEYALGQISPVGPQGDVLGQSWQVIVGMRL